jgi:hypothetical protein
MARLQVREQELAKLQGGAGPGTAAAVTRDVFLGGRWEGAIAAIAIAQKKPNLVGVSLTATCSA